MLESPSLLLRPIQPPQTARPDGSIPEIAILDLSSGALIGSVHRAASPWFRWLAPSAFEVFETDDLSHVFSLQRRWPWSPEWTVYDAEGRGVGTVLTPSPPWGLRLFLSDVRRPNFERVGETRIDDGDGRCVARMHANGEIGRFLSLAGEELGCVRREHGDRTLTFSGAHADNPFTRMLLLAATVVDG